MKKDENVTAIAKLSILNDLAETEITMLAGREIKDEELKELILSYKEASNKLTEKIYQIIGNNAAEVFADLSEEVEENINEAVNLMIES